MPPKKTQSKEPVVVDVAPVVEDAPAPAPVPESSDTIPVNQYTVILDKVSTFINDLKQIQTVLKALQKEHTKLSNQTSKKSTKRASNSRTPSGFAKPAILSDTLCDFLKIDRGSQLARTSVTKMINEYIKKNNLQDPQDKRHIVLDNELKKIITLETGKKLTYFNLQSYIKNHFSKSDA